MTHTHRHTYTDRLLALRWVNLGWDHMIERQFHLVDIYTVCVLLRLSLKKTSLLNVWYLLMETSQPPDYISFQQAAVQETVNNFGSTFVWQKQVLFSSVALSPFLFLFSNMSQTAVWAAQAAFHHRYKSELVEYVITLLWLSYLSSLCRYSSLLILRWLSVTVTALQFNPEKTMV